MHRLRSSRQRVNQWLFGALQPIVSQERQFLRVGLTLGQSTQDAKPASSQQIADYNGQFDPHLFEQTLHLTLQTYLVARELQFHPCQVAPSALFPMRDKTQDQLVCDQSPHQPLGILEVMLASPRGTVGECLRQLQKL